MRLIGNKTKLLPSIERFLRRRGVRGGKLLDCFAGTGSVSRHFRGLGFQVRSNDLMWSSFAVQRCYVATGREPDLRGLLDDPDVRRFLSRVRPAGAQRPLDQVVAYLGQVEGDEGLFARQYAEGGAGQRLFFSRENGLRIDAVHARLMSWRARGRLCDDGFYVLLVSLLEAADRAANISGTYGAFLKQLQPNAREPLRLRAPVLTLDRPAGIATRLDANEAVRRASVDVLYLDPPYNHRQYARNYHVLEALAELHAVPDVAAYEASIYGKTGLLPFEDRLSAYCRRHARGGKTAVGEAFADLVVAARAEHIVVSYSEEGLLGRDEIGDALARAAGRARYDFARDHEEVRYKRFRSDRDRAATAEAKAREYRVLEGRQRDEVAEWLFYVRKPAAASRRVVVAARAR